MTREDIEHIIGELAKHHSHDQIAIGLCERSGYTWDDASDLIRITEDEYAIEIAKRRLPTLVSPYIVMGLVGILLTVSSIYLYISGVQIYHTLYFLTFSHGLYLVTLIFGLGGIIGGIAGIFLVSRRSKG